MWAEWASFLSPLAALGDLAPQLPNPPGWLQEDGDDLSDDFPLGDGPGPVMPYAGYSTSCADLARLCHLRGKMD